MLPIKCNGLSQSQANRLEVQSTGKITLKSTAQIIGGRVLKRRSSSATVEKPAHVLELNVENFDASD